MPDGSDVTLKGSQARAEILFAAKRLFVSQGYVQTTMRDIARAAGSRAPGGIYNHFPSKDAIFQALIEEHNPAEALLAILESSRGETAPEQLRDILRSALPFMLKQYEFVELVQIDWREFQGKNLSRLLEGGWLFRILSHVSRVQSLPGL